MIEMTRKIKSGDVRKISLLNAAVILYTIAPADDSVLKVAQQLTF